MMDPNAPYADLYDNMVTSYNPYTYRYYYLLYGYQGNDTLTGEERNDTLYGGSGNDLLYGNDGNDILDGDEVTAVSDNARDTLYGGNGNDTLYGGEDNDRLFGDAHDDYLNGEDGNDTLFGGAGNDFLEGYFGDDSLDGGEGNDHLRAGPGRDFLEGYLGDDSLVGWTGDDHLRAGPGNDTLVGGKDGGDGSNSGNDYLVGWTGNDIFWGGDGQDTLYGGEDNLNGGDSGQDTLNGQEGNDLIYAGNGDDYLSGGTGNDTLFGGLGNDILNDTEGTINGELGLDTLKADYSSLSYNGYGVHLGYQGENTIRQRYTGEVVLSHQQVEAFDVTGTQHDDVLVSFNSSDTLSGGAGNDLLQDAADGTAYVTIYADAGYQGAAQILYPGAYNIYHLGIGNDTLSSLRIPSNLQVTLYEHGDFTGATRVLTADSYFLDTNFNDKTSAIVVESLSFDFLDGGAGNDTLSSSLGGNVFSGGLGNDSLVGGSGLNIAHYAGQEQDFTITTLSNGNLQVTDTNVNDGNEGTDSLVNIDQIAFGQNKIYSINGRTTIVSEVAGITGVDKQVYGDNSNPTSFIIDIQGSTELALNFDVEKLANFVNDITSESADIENARLAINLALTVSAGAVGALPALGAPLSTAIYVQQALFNYQLDLAQDEYKQQKTREAIQSYGDDTWITVEQPQRDIVIIKDFQIGVDNIILPTLPTGSSYGYSIKGDTYNGQSGAFIEITRSGEQRNFAFVENHYGTAPLAFEGTLRSLLNDGVITTFNQYPIIGNNPINNENIDDRIGILGNGVFTTTYASDQVIAQNGRDEVYGLFGDDLLQGGAGNDTLYGGSNNNPSLHIPSIVSYLNDGQDILQGEAGNDQLYGESGDDILDGGSGFDLLNGGLGNDIFRFNFISERGIFNTENEFLLDEQGNKLVDRITDFATNIDKIQISRSGFGADSLSPFTYNSSNGELLFNSLHFLTLDNRPTDFSIARDIVLV